MDIDWRQVVNSMPGPFPEIGLDAPEEEMIQEQQDQSGIIGTLTKLTLDIYIFDADELEQAYLMQNERMKIYQDISLKDAAMLYKKSKKKKA